MKRKRRRRRRRRTDTLKIYFHPCLGPSTGLLQGYLAHKKQPPPYARGTLLMKRRRDLAAHEEPDNLARDERVVLRQRKLLHSTRKLLYST